MKKEMMKKARKAIHNRCLWMVSAVLLLCMLFAGCGNKADIKYSGELDGLNWSIDSNGKLTVTGALNTGLPEWGWYETEAGQNWGWRNTPWLAYKDEITSAVMSFSGAESLYALLADYPQLKEADLTGMDTSKVTNMDVMFYHSANLETVTLKGCNLKNVESMNNTFSGCSSLSKVDFTNVKTSSKLTNLFGLFQGCSSLKTMDLSSFDTSGNPMMSVMFYKCSSMEEILVNKDWGTDADTTNMFDECGVDHVTVK